MKPDRDFLIVLGSRLLSVGLMLLSIRAATAALPPQQYGVLSLLVSFQVFCGLVLINPVNQHLNRNTHRWRDEGRLRAGVAKVTRWTLLCGLIGAGVLLVSGPLLPAEVDRVEAAVLVMIMVPATGLSAINLWLLNMLGHRGASALWTLLGSALGLTMSLLLAASTGTAAAWYVGQIAGMTLGALGASWRIGSLLGTGRKWPPAEPFMDRETAWHYCIPLAFVTVFMWGQVSGYRILFADAWGVESLGLAALGLGLAGQIFGVIEGVVMQYFYPMFYRRISDSDVDPLPLSDLLNIVGPIYVVVAFAVIACSGSIVALLVDKSYTGVSTFLAVGAVLELSRVLSGVLSNAAHMRRETTSLILPWALGSGLSLVLMVMAARMGLPILQGAFALAAGGAVVTATTAWRMHRAVPYRIEPRGWILSVALLAIGIIYARFAVDHSLTGPLRLAELTTVAVVSAGACAVHLLAAPALRRLTGIRLQQ